jgi:hypothetical protein
MAWPQIGQPTGGEQPIVRQYGVESIPSIWLIGPDGKVLAKNSRGEQIRQAVDRALTR